MLTEVVSAAAADAEAKGDVLRRGRPAARRVLHELAVRRSAGSAGRAARDRPRRPGLHGHRRHRPAADAVGATRPPPSSAGRSDVAVVTGAEALDTVRRLKKAGERPAWSHRDPEKKPFPFEAPFHPSEIAHEVFQAWLTFAVRDVARRGRAGIEPEAYRRQMGDAAGADDRGRGEEPARLVPGGARRAVADHADAGEPHRRLPVHEADGVDHGRRHGRRGRRRQPRGGRPSRRPRGSPRVPARLRVHARRHLRRRAPRPRAARRRCTPCTDRCSTTTASASTTWPTSTSTRASRPRCTSRRTRSASTCGPTTVRSRSPAGCRSPGARRATTWPTRSPRWSACCARTRVRSGWCPASACT